MRLGYLLVRAGLCAAEGRRLRIAAAAIATLIASVSAVAASPGAPSKTVITFSGFARSFDYDAGRVAWIDTAWALHIHTLRTGAESKILYTNPYEETPTINYNNPFEEYRDVPWGRQLVLEQQRLLWLSSRGCFGGPPGAILCEHVYAGTVDAPQGSRIANVVHGDGLEGGYLTGIAVDPLGSTYGVVKMKALSPDSDRFQVTGGGVWSVVGATRRRLAGAPPALVLARGAGRVALEPAGTREQEGGGPVGDGTVEIRDATTGALISTFSPGAVRALALTRTTAAVLVGRRIARYDVGTGRLLASTMVPVDTASELDVDGSRIVFRTRRAVKMLDAGTGRISTIATTTTWRPARVAIDGATVAWAESRRRAPGELSRKTFETRIRTAPV